MHFTALLTAVILPAFVLAGPVLEPRSTPASVTVHPSSTPIIDISSIVVPSPSGRPTLPLPTSIPENNGACQKLYDGCVVAAAPRFRNTFNKSNCVAMLTCLAAAPDQYATIDSIIGQMWVQVNDFSTDPLVKAKDQTAFSINIFNENSSDKKVWTQQNFIDFFYSTLTKVGGPYPDSSFVINSWANIAAWTGFCQTKAIPYRNLADYLLYSSNVKGAAQKC